MIAKIAVETLNDLSLSIAEGRVIATNVEVYTDDDQIETTIQIRFHDFGVSLKKETNPVDGLMGMIMSRGMVMQGVGFGSGGCHDEEEEPTNDQEVDSGAGVEID